MSLSFKFHFLWHSFYFFPFCAFKFVIQNLSFKKYISSRQLRRKESDCGRLGRNNGKWKFVVPSSSCQNSNYHQFGLRPTHRVHVRNDYREYGQTFLLNFNQNQKIFLDKSILIRIFIFFRCVPAIWMARRTRAVYVYLYDNIFVDFVRTLF